QPRRNGSPRCLVGTVPPLAVGGHSGGSSRHRRGSGRENLAEAAQRGGVKRSPSGSRGGPEARHQSDSGCGQGSGCVELAAMSLMSHRFLYGKKSSASCASFVVKSSQNREY
ncbi:MAG TPA: hypothetical protein VKZ59_00355, partial [Acidobacteriota bacterium]|nr:hypothetical protein [Acidobacteriota bacterium]